MGSVQTLVIVFSPGSGYRVIDSAKNVTLTLEGNNLSPKMTKKATGTCYLTTRRVIMLMSDCKDLHSFSMDFASMSSVELEQPLLGANYIKALIRAEPGGGWDGTAKMRLTFSSGGAINFGKKFLHMVKGGAPPAEMPPMYDDFNYNPYGPAPAPYQGQGGYAAPPYAAPGYAPPGYGAAAPPYGATPAGYAPGPAGYAPPPAPYGAPGPAYGAPGPAYGAPPPNYVFDQPSSSGASAPPSYSGNAMYSEANPGNVFIPQNDDRPTDGDKKND